MKIVEILTETQVVYTNQGATRRLEVPQRLYTIIQAAGKAASTAAGVIDKIEIFSGGQVPKGQQGPRTGSTRHDINVGAADCYLYAGGQQLSTAQKDPRIAAFIQACRAMGAVGIGAGPGYMNSKGIHVGFGKPAVWGAGGKSANAPSWVRAAYNAGASGQVPTTPNVQASNTPPIPGQRSSSRRTRARPTAGVSSTNKNDVKLLRNTGQYNPKQMSYVKSVQTALQSAGFSVGAKGIDGKYGPDTEAAVRQFQQSKGLKVDGIVGPETAAALGVGQANTKPISSADSNLLGNPSIGIDPAMAIAVPFIKELEGFYPNAYRDYAQISIGYGSKATSMDEVITKQEADKRLREELKIAQDNVMAIMKKGGYNWSAKQIAALISFAYNIGSIDQLTQDATRTDDEIAKMIPAYIKATVYDEEGNVVKDANGKPVKETLSGLITRRAKELKLYQEGMQS